MKGRTRLHRFHRFAWQVFLLALLSFAASLRAAPPFTAITRYVFGTNANSGVGPNTLVQFDGDTNFYGTCSSGPASHDGTVFKITPDFDSTNLFVFDHTTDSTDGMFPYLLVAASDGNLYGMSENFGFYTGGSAGTFFRLTPKGVFTKLYQFNTNAIFQGGVPVAINADQIPGVDPNSLIEGNDGKLYGACDHWGVLYVGAQQMGYSNVGSIFQITTDGQAMPVHGLALDASEGVVPTLMTKDANGVFYGVATGIHGGLFKVTASGAYIFLKRGFYPAGLAYDSSGVLCAVTTTNGINNTGQLFTLDLAGEIITTKDFGVDSTNNADGVYPQRLFSLSDGHVYGVSYTGNNVPSTVFRILSDGSLLTLSRKVLQTIPASLVVDDYSGKILGLGDSIPLFSLETPPSAITLGATNIGITNAVLIGQLSTGTMPATYWFDYGTATSNYSFFTSTPTTVTGSTNGVKLTAEVFLPLYSLAPYDWYFRLHAFSAAGDAPGQFLTLQQVLPKPVIQSLSKINGGVRIQWSAFTGLPYQLQVSTNLNQTNWFNMGPAATATNTSPFATDTNTGPARFYRVLIPR